MDPLSLSLLIGAGASLLSGFLGSNAAQKASDTQAAALDKQTALQAATIAQARADAAPWLSAGKDALAQYKGELGLSQTGAGGKPFVSQFQETPGYQFAVDQGQKGVVNNLGALGMRDSGAALKALTTFRTGIADQTYNTYTNKLASLAGLGQTTGTNLSSQALQSSAVQGQSIANSGAATASGYVGGANAWTGALGNFANQAGTALGSYNNNWQKIGLAA